MMVNVLTKCIVGLIIFLNVLGCDPAAVKIDNYPIIENRETLEGFVLKSNSFFVSRDFDLCEECCDEGILFSYEKRIESRNLEICAVKSEDEILISWTAFGDFEFRKGALNIIESYKSEVIDSFSDLNTVVSPF